MIRILENTTSFHTESEPAALWITKTRGTAGSKNLPPIPRTLFLKKQCFFALVLPRIRKIILELPLNQKPIRTIGLFSTLPSPQLRMPSVFGPHALPRRVSGQGRTVFQPALAQCAGSDLSLNLRAHKARACPRAVRRFGFVFEPARPQSKGLPSRSAQVRICL
jgi:hypothetical protein